uniref:non-ribosomal peptide synthetase n=1 Tax=Gordonia sp. GAMMA TaxID=2502241 RepID=UPI0010F502A8
HLIGVDRVSVTESFFALGGDSIMSIQLASAARAAGLDLSPREIFGLRTIRAMAATADNGAARLAMLEESEPAGVGQVTVSPVVHWMIEHSQEPADFADFVQAAVLLAPEDLDVAQMSDLLAAVVAAHPMLTATLIETEDGWQSVAGHGFDATEAVIGVTSTAPIGTAGFDADLRAAFRTISATLDPATGRLARAAVVRDPGGAGRVLVVIHHLGVDAVSWPVLIEDLVTGWAQLSSGRDIDLRAEQTSALAWTNALAARTDSWSGQVGHWLDRLPARPTSLGVELDRDRDRMSTERLVSVEIDADVTAAVLTSVPEAFGGNVNDVLLGAFARAVRSWQTHREVADTAPVTVLTEGHGRYEEVLATGPSPRRADLSRSVGWFTTLVPVSLDPGEDVVHAVKAAKEERLAQPDNGIGFGWLRYGPGADAELASRPLPTISFNYFGAGSGAAAAQTDALPFTNAPDAPVLGSSASGAMVSLAALGVTVTTSHDADGRRKLVAGANFPGALFTEDEIDALFGLWAHELSAVVDLVRAGTSIGLSPSDVPGTELTQHELDALAASHPGADIWPLTPLQRGLHFQAELAQGGISEGAVDVYVTQAILTLGGDVDVTSLQRAAQALFTHHRVLRSGYVRTAGGTVVAVVPPSVEIPWDVVDRSTPVAGAAPEDLDTIVAELADAQRIRPFDLASPPLVRFVVVRGPDTTRVIVTNHHIILDGWSGPLVLADLLSLYATGQTYTGQVARTTQDFADYLRRINGTDQAAGVAAWAHILADVDEPTLVAPGVEATADTLPQRHDVVVDARVASAVDALTRDHGITTATALQVAWAILLSRLTGNRVVTFGETVSGRPSDLDGVESMVGLFINTLPAVVDVDPQSSVLDILADVQAKKVTVLDHQHLGLSDILSSVTSPVAFDTLAVHESYPVDVESISEVDTGQGVSLLDVETTDATHYPLSFVTSRRGDEIVLGLSYLPSAFDDAQIRVFTEVLAQILAAMAQHPDTLSADIAFADASLLDTVRTWSVGRSVAVAERSLADAVVAQTAATPDDVAIVFEDRTVSYAEFGARVSALARDLVAAGAGPDVAVGVCIDRSVEMVVAAHAVVAAGGQYVPIDTGAPADRVAYMVDTAGVRVVLVAAGESPTGLAGTADRVRVIEVDRSAAVDPSTQQISDSDRVRPIRPDDAAYTLFTSGSTGRPKGVTVPHSAVMNFMAWRGSLVPDASEQITLLKAPYTFDASVWEMFWPLMTGGRVVVAAPGGHADPRYLRDLIGRHGVTAVQFVPSMLAVYLELADDESGSTSLRHLFTGGEALSDSLAANLHRTSPDVRLLNQYGPTETTVDLTTTHVVPGESVTMGRPGWNTTTWVLDSRLRPVPAGIAGELYLGGAQVARGYAGQPGLTAERFIADPFADNGARLYRTGDLVRWNTSGELEYLGRTDFQVKLRGQRIELGEIESVLMSVPGVVHAAATVVDDQLIGYVAPASVDLDAVKDVVAGALPEYMRPSVWMPLDAMPLNTAGKVARRELPAPEIRFDDFVAPKNAAERRVADIVAEVLGVDEVGVTASFFEMGGNSLSATRVIARVGDALGVEVSVRDLFESPTVRELVARLSGRGAGVAPVVAVSPRPELIPLSFAQQRIWFLNRFEPGSATHNLPAVLRLSGDLDADVLHSALVDVVRRHEVLRTTFPDQAGVPYQLIHPEASVADGLDWGIAGSQDELVAAVTAGFDVTTQWPIRVRLWRAAAGEHVLAIVLHHIGADGESMAPFVSDLVAAYGARVVGEAPGFVPLTVQFADFAIWQHSVLGSADDPESVVGRQLAYWTAQLAGLPDVLELPADRPRPAVASGRGDRYDVGIPAEIGARVAEVARGADVTPFMVVHTALAVLLARLSATDDIAIATPIAGRGQAVLDPLVGMFVNTLVLRTAVDGAQPFDRLLAQVRDTDLNAFAHADVPFETLVDRLNPVRSEAFSPLAQVTFSFDPAASAAEALGDAGGLTVTPYGEVAVTAQTDLWITVTSGAAGQDWGLSIIYATDLFEEATVVEFADRFTRLLAALTAAPGTAVGDAPFVAPATVAEIETAEWGDPVELPAVQTVSEAVAAQARRTPDATALVFGEREVTYAEFSARVNTLARALIAAGVGPDVAVALCVPRSVEMMVAIHAVVAAGGQYVPVDVAAPADRVRYMYETAGARVLLVADADGVPGAVNAAHEAGVRVMTVDASAQLDVDAASAAPVSDDERLAPLRPDDAAYTLFTSGSTGRPKGVTLSHAAVLNRLWWGLNALPIGPDDVVMQKTPYTFDCSVPELFAPLAIGARVVVLADGGHLNPRQVADEIARTGTTMVHFVPSMLSVFLEVVDREQLAALDTLRIVSTTGEALPPAVAAPVRELWPDAWFFNLYGPTEAAVEITFERIHSVAADDPTVPIGVPVWNSSAVVLDSRLRRVPPGVPGELYLGGVQLARGYAARPDLTAERFVADPYGEPGSRLYRTGDLVRRRPDGVLEYLGRTDFQVKLRGQRIELGEIEAVIASAPGVVHAAATVATAPGGGEHLVGYVAGVPGDRLDIDAVKSVVAASLPEYMRPSVWMPVEDIALNTAGKIDRRALPEPVFSAGEYVEPADESEAAVAAVFADVLGLDRVSVTDSFFDLGGNSLSAMRLAARVGEVTGSEISVRDLFDAPSVRELSRASADLDAARAPIVAVSPRPERIPLAFAQQRMWFVNQADTTSPAYNIPVVLRLSGSLDEDALHAALIDVVSRHESLRTTFPSADGTPYQKINRATSVAARLDWDVVSSQEEIEAAVSAGFDVSRDWPIRARIWEVAPDEHVFAVVTHHIASDGESMMPLVSDVVTAYLAETADADPDFADLEVQFADFAIWQHDVLGSPDDPESVVGRQLAYWVERLAGLPDVIDVPTDRPRPARASQRGGRASFTVPAEVGDRIARVAQDTGATPFMVVHAALAALLSRLSATDDIAIGTPVAGRGQRVLDPLIGMFVNTLVLRTSVDLDRSFADLLEATREADLGAFANADVPFEIVVDAAGAQRSAAFAPFTQVWLTFDQSTLPELAGADLSVGEVAGLQVSAVDTGQTPARVDLLIGMTQPGRGEEWAGTITYATDLFDESTAVRLGEQLVGLLTEAVDDPRTPLRQITLGDTMSLAELARAAAQPEPERTTVSIADSDAVVTGGPGTEPVVLGDLFARAAAKWGPRQAVVDADNVWLSYADLDARSNRLARWMIGQGIGPEKLVALAIVRSAQLLVAIWAVAKTGGGYVPIDPDYPAERVANMVEDSGAILGLAVQASGTLPGERFSWLRLDDATLSAEIETLSDAPITAADRRGPVRVDNVAYVI